MRRPREAWGLPHCRRGGRAVPALVVVGVLTAALTVSPAPAARADGDPASDTLISENVFYPYSSPVPQSDHTRLDAAVSAAHRGGVALKVAIIARRADLGSVTALYGDPQRYATFLDTEISLNRPEPLLVVMAGGDGDRGLSPGARRAVAAAPRARADTGAALGAAALAAVNRIDRTLESSRAAQVVTRLPPVLLPALVLAAAFAVALLIIVATIFPAT